MKMIAMKPAERSVERFTPVLVHIAQDMGYVWDAAGAWRLRTECGLVGAFSGTLPVKHQQNSMRGLPLTLSPEEVCLAMHKGWIDLVRVAQPSNMVAKEHTDQDEHAPLMCEKHGNDGREVQEGCRTAAFKGPEVCSQESVADLVSDRERRGEGEQDGCTMGASQGAEALSEMGVVDLDDEQESGSRGKQRIIDQVAAGLGLLSIDDQFACSHGGKYGSSIEKKGGHGAVKEEEVEGWEELFRGKRKGAVVIPLVTSNAEIHYSSRHKLQAMAGWTYPRTVAQAQRCAVFADLHSRGYFLTNGGKFGADFLAYPGDPSKFHSAFAVQVIDRKDTLMPLGLIGAARVALTARKRLVLAFVASGAEGSSSDCLNNQKNDLSIKLVEPNAANELMVEVDDTAKEQPENATSSNTGEGCNEKCEIDPAPRGKENNTADPLEELSLQGRSSVLSGPSLPKRSPLQKTTHMQEVDVVVDGTEEAFASPRRTTNIESDGLSVPAGKQCRTTSPHQIHQRDNSKQRTLTIHLDDDDTCHRWNDGNLGSSHEQQQSSDLYCRGSRPYVQTAERADRDEAERSLKGQVVEETLQNRSLLAATSDHPDERRCDSRGWAYWIGKLQYITVSPDLNFVVLNFRPTKVIRDQEKALTSLTHQQ